MEKNSSNKIIDFIKHKILRIPVKYKDPKTGMVYIVTESEMDKYLNKGTTYWGKKKYTKAIEMIRKGIEFDKEDYLGYWYLGQIYQEMGDIKAAEVEYSIALKNAEARHRQHPKLMEAEIIEGIKKDMKGLKEG
jgi:tetratricopeptide (TPR) repeat protein